jgi:hypothetical protein
MSRSLARSDQLESASQVSLPGTSILMTVLASFSLGEIKVSAQGA